MLKKFTLLAVCLLLTVALLEVFLRVLQPHGAEKIPAFTEDALTGIARAPNQHGFILQRVPGVFAVKFQTNSRGWRDREYPLEKNGKLRILCLGDSTTEGWGVEEDEAYSKVLEREFLQNVEVWNLGVAAFSTDQELVQLRNAIDTYRPDLVTLGFFHNDLYENTISRMPWHVEHVKPKFEIRGDQLVLTNAADVKQQKVDSDRAARGKRERIERVLEEFALYRLIRYVERTAFATKPRPGNRESPKPQPFYALNSRYRVVPNEGMRDAWKLAERLLVEVNRLCAQHGAAFVLLYIPEVTDGIPGMLATTNNLMHLTDPLSAFDVTLPERNLAALAHRNGIRFVEGMGDSFRHSAHPEELFVPLTPRDQHIGVEGHHFVAQRLADFLRREKLLPDSAFRATTTKPNQ